MAILKNPLSSEDARNKFGPVIVFSGWRTVKVARTNVRPTNPRTAAQLNIRSIVTQLSQEWNGLSLSNASAWNDYAAQRPLRNEFGEFNASGINWYIKLNFARAYNALASNAAPPTAAFTGNIDTFAAAGGAAGGEVDLSWNTPAGATVNDWVRLDASRQMNSIHYRVQPGDYRIESYEAGTATTYTVTGLVSGGWYAFLGRFVMEDGREGSVQVATAQAT